jgi:hypothetical protein
MKRTVSHNIRAMTVQIGANYHDIAVERVRFFQDGAETMTEGVDDEYMRRCPEEYASHVLPCHVVSEARMLRL